MRHSLRFKIVTACFSCYLAGDFLGGLFMHQDNKVAMVLAVMIPTIALLCYMSMIVHSVQAPAKKKPIPRRAFRIVRHDIKAVR